MVSNPARYQAWLDSLPSDQHAMVQRTEDMPIEMALQYMWVDLDTKIEELRRPLWRQALAPVTAFGAVVTALLTPDVPRP